MWIYYGDYEQNLRCINFWVTVTQILRSQQEVKILHFTPTPTVYDISENILWAFKFTYVVTMDKILDYQLLVTMAHFCR